MRYIILGYGNIGQKRKKALGGRCVAIVDPFNEDADFKKISAVSPDLYDAAILCVPNSEKLELIQALLELGKHVLVEKPLNLKDEDYVKINNLLQEKKLLLMTGYNHRFEPNVMKMKELLSQGFVGDLYNIRMVYGNGTVKNIAGTWRDVGSGVLDDLGCHLLDLAVYLFGHRDEEHRLWVCQANEASTPDHVVFSSLDSRIIFECSYLMWKNTFKIEVAGSKGTLSLDGLNKWGESKLRIDKRVFPSGVPETETIISSGNDSSWESEIKKFEEYIHDKTLHDDTSHFIKTACLKLVTQFENWKA
ncbi:Gfo/Idh/MocA family protein [Curvivirga aplysinae]|uniref:Gfo/Idh/MocA family protein n=1 Tax=Curvivirga aplysinae TaxID=2529852 RepID=UPI0012BC15C8|nr:Gfo/Idh/MocA family oxidoreductase [Curvivirga aplysinae]MTI08302.1 Gfo/Idh/MocA family oxidoreductase [Curvivirga aplysinae]